MCSSSFQRQQRLNNNRENLHNPFCHLELRQLCIKPQDQLCCLGHESVSEKLWVYAVIYILLFLRSPSLSTNHPNPWSSLLGPAALFSISQWKLEFSIVLEGCGKLWPSDMVHPTQDLRYGARWLLTCGRSQNGGAPQKEVTALGEQGGIN